MRVKLDVHCPLLLAPGEGETVTDRPERTLRILAELEQVIVTWFRYEPGEKGPDPHIHWQHTDAFYVLEGEVEFKLGPDLETSTGLPGTLAAAPPNVVHTFQNASDATAIFLNFHAPSMGFGDHIRGQSDAFDQFEPPVDGGRDDGVLSGPGEGERIEHDTSTLLIKSDLQQLDVLEGEAEFHTPDGQRRAGPASFSAAPRGTVHGFRNAGPEPLRVLNIHAPEGGFVGRVRGR